MPKLSILFLLALALIGLTEPAMASLGAGGNLPWEAPLTTLVKSMQGPVAAAISFIAIVGAGAMLVWGGEINEFLRRIIYLVLVIALLVFSGTVISKLFTGSDAASASSGALIPASPAPRPSSDSSDLKPR